MIVVNRIGDNISVSCRDKHFSVLFSDAKFEKLLGLSERSQSVKTMDELKALIEEAEGICKNDMKEKVEDFHPELYVQPVTKKFYMKLNGKISSVAIPEALVRRIRESMEKKISVDPIIKAWKRFLKNPKMIDRKVSAEVKAEFARRFVDYIEMTYVMPDLLQKAMDSGLSREIATEQARTFEVKITNEGLLACYKVSQEVDWKFVPGEDGKPKKIDRYAQTFDEITGEVTGDSRDNLMAEDRIFMPKIMGDQGDKFYCEGLNGYKEPGHLIKVGCVHRLPDWSFVDTNDRVDCVKGLHVGGLGYIAKWGGEIHTCFVDPMHIGAIPDYSGSKAIRVLQYFVDGSLKTLNKSIYHSSEYAKKTDEQWAEVAKEILAEHGELNESVADASEEVKAL